jgi:hypothetical protein
LKTNLQIAFFIGSMQVLPVLEYSVQWEVIKNKPQTKDEIGLLMVPDRRSGPIFGPDRRSAGEVWKIRDVGDSVRRFFHTTKIRVCI